MSALPLLLAAAPAAQAARPVAHAGPGLVGAFFALLLVLGLILGLAWLLKRLPGSGFRPADGVRVVASLPLGARERAVVVEVGGRQLLLGVSAGGVTLLQELPEPLPPAEPVRLPNLSQIPDFAQLLSQRLRRNP